MDRLICAILKATAVEKKKRLRNIFPRFNAKVVGTEMINVMKVLTWFMAGRSAGKGKRSLLGPVFATLRTELLKQSSAKGT